MDIRLLGPIEASLDGRPVALGPPQQRAVLAMLALKVNRTVSADLLSEGLWGERAPATAPKIVQLYVSQLRKLLREGPGEIVTRGRGYELRLAVERVDAARFERLIVHAGAAEGLADGGAREALAMWRGDPLADIAHEPFAAAEIRRLEDLRVQAAELAIDADLAARRHREVVGELRSLIAEEPLRERLRAQFMLALYRSGRQAEALEAYRDARAVLVESIGVEPGPELRRLHEAVLCQDRALAPPGPNGVSEAGAVTPLVGRAAELEWLRGHWRRAAAGAGGVVVVAGPRGIGKTRLVAELAREVAGAGAAVLSGSAPETLAAARAAREPTLLVLGSAAEPDGFDGAPVLAVAEVEDAAPAARTLVLGALGVDGVRALAALYADGADVPAERLLAASRGVPSRVHEAAAEWARTLELRRLDRSVGRVASNVSGLRAAEDDLVGSIVKLQAGRERGAPDALATPDICPFKGLACFDAGDAEFFFGRERLVAEMVAKLAGNPWLGIVGPSGSGKSSVLRAGLFPALAAGVLPGSEGWAHAVLRPGEHPLRALNDALAAAAGGGRLVVAVDQFEEVFTACRDECEREAFVAALVASARDGRRRTIVVVVVRADYYGRCAAYPELARPLGASHVLVGAMADDELRRAIELPARRAGLVLERPLADALVADVSGRAGALPLLSSALLELWQCRDDRTLRFGEYTRAGGVRGAVARLAEGAYEQLDASRRPVARRIFLRLAGGGEGDDMVRRRARLSEFEGGVVAEVLDVLVAARLLTTGDGEVEVAHEALLREWPRLRDWLREDAEARRLHQHLIEAARGWSLAGRDPAELYRGVRLAAALEWSARHEAEPNALEREFVAVSRAVAESETARQRRANRRLRALLGGVAALLALAVVAGAVAVSQRGAARRAALTADAQRLGAEAVTRDHLDQALLLARAGVDLTDSAVTRSHLLSVLMRTPQALATLPTAEEPLWHAALSPDGRLLALAGGSGAVTVLDTARSRPVGPPYRVTAAGVADLKFSPDARTLAITTFVPEGGGTGGGVDLITVRTLTRRLQIMLPPFPGLDAVAETKVLFAPNGRDVIVHQLHEDPRAGPASVLRRFDGTTGRALGPPLRLGHRHGKQTMSGTRDRRRLFVTNPADDETYMLDPERLRVLRRWPVGDLTGIVSADGSVFALGSKDGGVRLLDLRTGRVRTFAGGHDAPVLRMRFAAGGRTLVTAGDDGKVIVWDVAHGAIQQVLTGHAKGTVYGLDVAAEGRTAYSAGSDKRVFAWDLDGGRSLVRPFAADRPFRPDDGDELPRGVTLSPDGHTLAIGHSDGMVDLLDARTLRVRRSVHALRGFVAAVAYSPDGRLLAATGQYGHLTLWDARTLQAAGELHGQHTTSQALAFSPDGTLLAAAELGIWDGDAKYNGGHVRVWDVKRRAPTSFDVKVTAPAITFSRDGRLLAFATMQRPTEIRAVHGGALVASLPTPADSRSVAFSPDGRAIVTGHYDGTAQLWSTKTWRPIGRPLEGHDDNRVLWLGFTPDGTILATAGQDGTLELVDAATQTRIGELLSVEPDSYLGAALSPDGRYLFAVAPTRAAVRWTIAPAAWKRHACRVAGRELTLREWHDALPGRPYRAVCQS